MAKPTILITGARSMVALHMARSFAENGYDVHLADCSSALMARLSTAPRQVHTYAAPRQDTRQFYADIKKILMQISPVAVIPTCEEVFYLASPDLAAVLKDKLFAAPLAALKTLHAKDYFIQACANIGAPTPETHTLANAQALDALGIDPREWVFKQRYSRFGATTFVSPEKSTLAGIKYDDDNPWLAQRRVHGTEISFYAIAKAGKLVAFAPYTSGWRLQGNASYAFFAADKAVSARLQAFAAQMAEHLVINGQFSCDMMVDAAGGVWPLECNPRATSGLHLLSAGAHVAACMDADTAHCHTAYPQPRYQLATLATYGLCKALAEGRLREWFYLLLHGCDVMGARGDRLPLVGALIDAFIFKCTAIKNKTTLSQSTTADIEWNGEPL